MALVYIGCYHATDVIAKAAEILTGRNHRVEVFTSLSPLIVRAEQNPPNVLLLPLYFKGPLLYDDVLTQTQKLLKSINTQIGLFAQLKPDGDPTIGWQDERIHAILMEPFTPMQIAVFAELLIHRIISVVPDI